MKKPILSLTAASLVFFSALSGCWPVTHTTHLEVRGRVHGFQGDAQRIDLNTEIELCVEAAIRGFTAQYLRVCKPLTTSANGDFVMQYTAEELFFKWAWQKGRVMRLERFKVELQVAGELKKRDRRTIEGRIDAVRTLPPNGYQVTADFTVNISHYHPDVEVDLNRSSKKYSQ